MSNLVHYFSSFDKLMKERLVAPLFWLLVLYLGLVLLSEVFDIIGIDSFDAIIDFVNLFLAFLVVVVAVRVVCELAVAIFRINDNLSPDKGVSSTADIDPVAEARRAAEDAARRARQAADQAMERTQSVTRRAVDSTKAAVSDAGAKTADVVEDLGDRIEEATDKVKARADRTFNKPDAGPDIVPDTEPRATFTDAPDPDDFVADNGPDVPPIATLRPVGKPSTTASATSKTATPKASAATTTSAPRKRGRPKGSKTEVRIDPVTGERLKKDGTPYKKPGPKPSGKSPAKKSGTGKRGRPKGSKTVYKYDEQGRRLKKDGTLAKKPGPKAGD